MTDDNQQQSHEHHFAPGALLKRTREEKGLTLEEVSTQLKLTHSVLNNIENDDYKDDLAITFYRGYLKNYAELLGLNGTDVVANFQQYCQSNQLLSESPPKLQGLELEKPINPSNWLFKIVTGVIIVAFLAAIYYVLVEKELWKKMVPDGASENTSETVLPMDSDTQHNLSLGSNSLSSSDNTVNSVSDEAGALSVDSGQLEANRQENRVAETTRAAGQPETVQSETVQSETVQAGANQATSAVNQNDDASQQTEQNSPAASPRLLLVFTGDCWVRIEDATGKVLALGLQSPGTSLQLSGQAPYSLTLGKASAVQLSYDGVAVDLTGYSDNRAAKLTLGEG